jgi:CHAD domain-containing protein
MPAQELLLTALDQRYEKYLIERKRCKKEFSAEGVHDLRIATRRLLALIDLLRTIALAKQPAKKHSRLQKLVRAFKDQLDSLDNLRDTQMMLAEISETLETLPELAPLQKFLQKREKRLLKATEHEVRTLKAGAIAHRIEKVRAGLAGPANDPNLLMELLTAVDDAFSTVARRMGQVDAMQPSTIHRTRIAFKKFRYKVEIIHPVLPGCTETLIDDIHDYQTVMGDIQDMEVMLHTLENFATGHKAYDSQSVRNFYEQRHIESINIYIENMNEFSSFWRETPEKPFPWETQEKEKL